MSDTIIQIKRSTTTALPANLQPGELAYTSNGEVLYIGSAVGTDVANVVAIAGKRFPGTLTANQALVANSSSWIDNIQTGKIIIGTVGTTANITAFTTDGTFAGANVSNSTIASTWAIKDYVDNNSAADLAGLDDVDTTGIANNYYLVYDGTASKWEPHFIQGTANEVDVSFSNNDLTIGLPNDVTISANLSVTNSLTSNTANITGTTTSSNTTTGALTVAGGVGINGKLNVTEAAVGTTSNYTSINATAVGTNNVFANGTVNASVLSVGGWVVANNSGVFTSGVVNADIVQVGTYFKANTTAVVVDVPFSANATVKLGDSSSDNISINGYVNTAIVPNANVTYSLGTTNNRWQNVYTQEIVADTGVFSGEVTVSGNLTVLGDLLTVNVSTLAVEDPLIQLATNNTIGDTVDIGFFGNYNVGGGSHEHTGFFRDATDGVYKLFTGLEPTPTTTVDTSNNTFTIATLEAYLLSGALTSNTTAVTITANSSVNVNITANSLSLTTALTVPSGGTGQTTFANNGVLYGNTAGALSVTAAGANGNVLKVVNNVPSFGMLDGGTF